MTKRILFVEDDRPTVEVYGIALKEAGFEMESLEWGYKALDRLREVKEGKKKKPDLILLDLILPDMNGIEILKMAKGDEKLKDIPIFVLTNYTDPELEKESWRLGAEKYIVKANYTPSQLMEVIKEWFKNK